MPQPDDTTAPIFETERLRLRPHMPKDLDDCAAMWSDPEVVQHTIGTPSTTQRSWMRMLTYRGLWAMLGYGYWAVEEKATGQYIGDVGFADFKRGLSPLIEGMPEIGWALAPHAHGKGYATEALLAVIAWGDHHFGPVPTACIIHPDNAGSLRVAEKLGYQLIGQTDEHGLFVRPPAAS